MISESSAEARDLVRTTPPGKRKLYGGVMISKAPEYLKGGWMQDQTFTEDVDPFNPHETKTTDYRYLEEPEFYKDRYIEYNENGWYSFLVDYLVGELFCDFEFDGPGAKEVEAFFKETCPDARQQVEMMGLNVVREGTGGLKKLINGSGKLMQIEAMNGRLIRLEEWSSQEPPTNARYPPFGPYTKTPGGAPYVDGGGNTDFIDTSSEVVPGNLGSRFLRVSMRNDPTDWYADMLMWPRMEPVDYLHDEIALCRIRRDPRTPYGISFGRACFHDIKALRSLNRDIVAALKRLAAVLLVLKADLSQYDGDDAKQAALENAVKMFQDLDSASTGVIGIDMKNDLGYPSGNRTERLIPIMQHLEPVLSSILMNFLFALGLIEQTGANKSLIAKQEIRAEKQLRRYHASVASFMEVQVFPHITDKECHMRFNAYLDPEFWLSLWQTSAVSRERIQREYSVIDSGKTYFHTLTPPTPVGAGPGSSSSGKANDFSKDDSNEGRRQDPKADTSVSKARG